MTERKLKVKDMPPDVAEACRERGFMNNVHMTPLEAMREWSGWNLGNPSWVDEIISQYEEMRKITEASND
jgi:hypothetical protein